MKGTVSPTSVVGFGSINKGAGGADLAEDFRRRERTFCYKSEGKKRL